MNINNFYSQVDLVLNKADLAGIIVYKQYWHMEYSLF